jgi:hypothetical protein
MARYRVSLLKHLVDSYGRRFTTLQGQFELEAANAKDAELAAEHQFASQRHVTDWHLFADTVRTEHCDGGGARPCNRSAGAAGAK